MIVQRASKTIRIGKTAAAAVAAVAEAAAVAVKKEQRLPCLRTRRPKVEISYKKLK